MEYYVESVFEHCGLKCVVVFQKHGHRCGYVGVSVGHLLYGASAYHYLKTDNFLNSNRVFFDEDDFIRVDEYFTCHGGITYSGHERDYPLESNLWWFGFDCAHYGDDKDFECAKRYFPENIEEITIEENMHDMYQNQYLTVRTLEYVQEECRKLAEQLVEFEVNNR